MYRELRKIGLTQYEAKIYRALLVSGRTDAKQISKKSGVPITAVYPNLKSLIEKQLVIKLDGDVAQYEAQRPRAAIPAYVERKQALMASLSADVVRQANAIKQKPQFDTPREVVKLSIGKRASHEIYKDLIKSSKESLYILGWRMKTVGDKYTWLRTYSRLVKRGVDVRLIIIGKGMKQKELISAYRNAGIKVRYLPLENFSLVVADAKECKITLKSRDLPNKFNIRIDDCDLSGAMHAYFLSTWKRASTQMI